MRDLLQKLHADFGKIKNNTKFLQNLKIHLAFLEKVCYNVKYVEKYLKNGDFFDEIL